MLQSHHKPGRQRAGSGPRCVCRCGSASSIWRSLAVIGSAAPNLTRASSRNRAGSGSSSTTGTYPSDRTASRSPNSAAPQLMSISRPIGSTPSLRRWSAYSSIAYWPTRNRHGWVLCTDGARAAVPIR